MKITRSMIYTDTLIYDLKQKIAYNCYSRILRVTCLVVYDKKNPFFKFILCISLKLDSMFSSSYFFITHFLFSQTKFFWTRIKNPKFFFKILTVYINVIEKEDSRFSFLRRTGLDLPISYFTIRIQMKSQYVRMTKDGLLQNLEGRKKFIWRLWTFTRNIGVFVNVI
jgi:hypothetical protein